MASAKATARIETEMKASSSSIWGRPDIVVLHHDGTAEVIDVKTGDYAGTEPTERGVRQLQLYATIVAEARGDQITRLRIERIDGKCWAIPARRRRRSSRIDLGRRIRVAHLRVQIEVQYRWQPHRSLAATCSPQAH